MKVSSGLGLVAVLLFALAVGVQYGYIASATLGDLTVAGLAFFGVLAAIAAIVFYSLEEPKRGFQGGYP